MRRSRGEAAILTMMEASPPERYNPDKPSLPRRCPAGRGCMQLIINRRSDFRRPGLLNRAISCCPTVSNNGFVSKLRCPSRHLTNRGMDVMAEEAFSGGFDMAFIFGSGNNHLVAI